MEQEKNIAESAKRNMAIWLTTLKTKNPVEVASLYAENCDFLPTVSGEFKHGQSGAESYFKHFLQKNPEGKVIDENIKPIGSNAYTHSGMYNFILDDGDKRKVVQARFTYNWQKDTSGKWLIITHHSSIRPESN